MGEIEEPEHAKSASVSDFALLERLSRRDEAAFSALFHRHSRLVYGIALRILREPSQAEDLLQDLFLQLWKNPVLFRIEQGSFSSFLAVVTRNRAIDFLRTRKWEQFPDNFDMASKLNLATSAEHEILLERVRAAAAALPFEQRLALDLAFFEGLTHSEIAAQTETPLGTVKTRIRAAVSMIGRNLV